MQFADQVIIPKKTGANIVFENRIPLIAVQADGIETKFIFDTGATRTCLTDSTIIPDFSAKKFASIGAAKGADGKKIKVRTFPASLKSEVFDSEKKVLTSITMPYDKCNPATKAFSGILGMDVFFEEKLGMQLDFSTNKVYNITQDQINSLLLQGQYEEIKAAFKYKRIFIFLTIEGKEYKFLLDTGYIGSIVIPYDNKRNFTNSNKIELEGIMHMTISGLRGNREIIYENMPVILGKQKLQSKVNVSSSLTAQNVGIEFMKGFDWIIDYHNHKIYIKRNSNAIENALRKKFLYYAKVIREKLKITAKEKSQTQYQLGDEITHINSIKVTPENNCEMQDLLNKTPDWNALELEVIHSK